MFTTNTITINDSKKRNVLVACDHGLMIVNRFDTNEKGVGQGQWILDHGNASTVEAFNTYESINKPNPIIFDIGANIGTYSTWLAKMYPQGKIYCFEPQRLVFQILCGNLALNNIDNVYAYNYGLADSDNLIEISEPDYNKPDNFGSYSLIDNKMSSTQNKCKVNIYKLDNFVSKYNIPYIDFLKIDCEGMDFAVLLGSVETIRKFKPIILIEYKTDWSDDKDKIINFLQQYNYEYTFDERNILAR